MIAVLKNRLPEMNETLPIFQAALAAVDPFHIVSRNLSLRNGRLIAGSQSYALDEFTKILVAGAGKAAAGMGEAVEAVLGDRISGGLLIMPKGVNAPLRYLTRAQAAHPLPDQAGRRASLKILERLGAADEKTLVLFLLSGGASAMLTAPVAGVTLVDKRTVTSLLLHSAAAIGELNAVRKHLSAVKGGRLAAAAFPAAVLTLAISDVIGNRGDRIGSGPTVGDETTFATARAVIEKYHLQDKIPAGVKKFLERGLAGLEAETVRPDDPRLARSTFEVIGDNARALAGARTEANVRGWQGGVSAAPVQGEARTAARSLAASALKAQAGLQPGEKRCLLSGGETTVTVSGSGRGGRNQELALAFALEIAGCEGIELLSAGTDGIDGPTDAAGAVVDGATIATAASFGLDAAAYLDNNDSYGFFSELDRLSGSQHHLKTGPTGTNVMDLQVILLSRSH